MGENGAIAWTNERRKLRDLVPWEHNPRAINKREAERLGDSLAEFGQIQTIAIGPDNEVYDGHQRKLVWSVLPQFGPDYEVDVRVSSRPLTDKERQKLVIYLHRGTMGDWDWDELANSFEMPDLLEWGFSEAELVGDWGEEPTPDPGAQVDRAAELQEKWGVARGDIWEIPSVSVPGKFHRVMCGDSTSGEDVGRLMGGERAGVCFTSPPYAQQRDYTGASDVRDWDALMQGVFAQLPMTDDGQVLVNLGLVHKDREWQPYWNEWIEWMRTLGWLRFGWYVWDQGSGLPGDWNGRLAPSFEFVFHFNKHAIKPKKTVLKKPSSGPMGSNLRTKDGRNRAPSSVSRDIKKIPDSVIRVNRNSAHGTGHPAIYPVPLAADIVALWGGEVYDPFLGSGTTIVACEQTGRIGYGMEIEPKYVAVTLERLAGMGLEPQRVTQ